MTINIKEKGAVGDGVTCNTALIQEAIDQCSEAGGGKVVVSEGCECIREDIVVDSFEMDTIRKE